MTSQLSPAEITEDDVARMLAYLDGLEFRSIALDEYGSTRLEMRVREDPEYRWQLQLPWTHSELDAERRGKVEMVFRRLPQLHARVAKAMESDDLPGGYHLRGIGISDTTVCLYCFGCSYGSSEWVSCFQLDCLGEFDNSHRILPAWRTDTVLGIARNIVETRDFTMMPILADALQDAGCYDETIITHCCREGAHDPTCWVLEQLGSAFS
jgi:hypothetical protein